MVQQNQWTYFALSCGILANLVISVSTLWQVREESLQHVMMLKCDAQLLKSQKSIMDAVSLVLKNLANLEEQSDEQTNDPRNQSI